MTVLYQNVTETPPLPDQDPIITLPGHDQNHKLTKTQHDGGHHHNITRTPPQKNKNTIENKTETPSQYE